MAEVGDIVFLDRILSSNAILGPVLEVGSRAWDDTALIPRRRIEGAGLEWVGADLTDGPNVDLVFDLLDDSAVAKLDRQFSTLLLFNLLEHVYDPAAALRNALSLLSPGGHCVIVTPLVHPLHDYPADYWRPLPDFFVRCATENDALVDGEHTYYIGGYNGEMLWLVDSLVDDDGQKFLPSRSHAERTFGRRYGLPLRLALRYLKPHGLRLEYTKLGLGVLIRKNA